MLGGDGTVTSSPAGINCGGSCSATYASGTTVVLTATPATGSRFTGWGGACGGTGVCTLFVNSTFIDPSILTPMPNVTAGFERTIEVVLSVTTAGTGGGTVTSSPTASYCVSIPGQSQICSIGIICGSSCRASYPVGTVVTLSAIPNNNSIFVGWVGACSGTVSCVLTMNTDQTVGATFDLPPQLTNYTLTVNRIGLGSGTVVSTPAGIACGATCTATFSSGTLVTLAATPASGSQFNGWGGACIGTGSCVVSMTQMHSVTARFDPPAVLNNYYANWSCGASNQCAAVMGGSFGSAGPFCSLTACQNWGNQFIPFGYACATQATHSPRPGGSQCNNFP